MGRRRAARGPAAAVQAGSAEEPSRLGRKEEEEEEGRGEGGGAVMATNIEEIFRSFVVNKFREMQEEQQQQHGG